MGSEIMALGELKALIIAMLVAIIIYSLVIFYLWVSVANLKAKIRGINVQKQIKDPT